MIILIPAVLCLDSFSLSRINPKFEQKKELNLNTDLIRADFPFFQTYQGRDAIAYFDNAATTQKPFVVIDAIKQYYEKMNANVHRGNHALSILATEEYEKARKTVCDFIHAASTEEIIFTRGTTESVNLVASGFAKKYLGENDEILISGMEHHSNLVPWQIACQEKKAKLRVLPVSDTGTISLVDVNKMINARTRMVAITHISNTLGTVNPVKEIIEIAHKLHVPVLVDGAQAAPHLAIDVADLDCDFYCFSGHKVYGPTGIGVLYGKKEWLNNLPPYQLGGEMIRTVSFDKTTFNELPWKFEAGTPNIVGGIVLAKALKYVRNIGFEAISRYENYLLDYATEILSAITGLRIIGTDPGKASVISFVVDGIHPGDLGILLDKMHVAVRTGNHCTEPLMKRFNTPGTVRASFAFYNTDGEIDKLIEALKKAISMLK